MDDDLMKRLRETADGVVKWKSRAERAEAQVAALRAQLAKKEREVQLLVGLAEICERHGVMPSSRELVEASKAYTARIKEEDISEEIYKTTTESDS